MSSAGSEKPNKNGIFGNRRFSIISALPPTFKSKDMEQEVNKPPEKSQQLTKNRSQRALTPSRKINKSESAATRLIDSSTVKNDTENTDLQWKSYVDNFIKDARSLHTETATIGDIRSTESTESFDLEFSLASEIPLTQDEPSQREPAQNLLKQIETLATISNQNESECKKVQTLVGQLSDQITASEQAYKKRIKEMKKAQDNSFGELFLEKNEEITKLQKEVEMLKIGMMEKAEVQMTEEIVAAKNEAERLRELLKEKTAEIGTLTYQLIDAQTNIEMLEREKYISQSSHPNAAAAKNHFKTIKQALRSNSNMLRMIQSHSELI